MRPATYTLPMTTPTDAYRERSARFIAERDARTATWNLLANLRLLAFVVAVAAGAWGLWGRSRTGVIIAVAALITFVILAVWHNRVGKQRDRAALFVDLNDRGIARINRNWSSLDPVPGPLLPADHPFAHDIDLFGRASLACLLDTAATPMGRAARDAALLYPAAPNVAAAHHGAIADLAPRLDWRQHLEATGRLADDPADPAPFLAWAEGTPVLSGQRWLLVLAWLGPITFVILAIAQALNLISGPWWVGAIVANLAIAGILGKDASAHALEISSTSSGLRAYAEQIRQIADEPFTDPHAVSMKAKLADAPDALARLARLASMPLPVGSPAGSILAALTCWDLHVLAALERWQAQHGHQARQWLSTLGDVESLAALATLAHDNPDWVNPSYAVTHAAVAAEQIGHPLLAAEVRKHNDVAVGPAGTFLLVTGSNMSGKSTLLRAIGLNAVLAGAGAPVCAASLAMPPVTLWTSARVTDSLEQGVSFFMAELRRLKQVVDAADAARAAGGPPVLALLDEILQGTNTAERQIAARRIIRHLVAQGALVAVSTHDLALADAPELAAAVRPVHFRDEVRDGRDGMEMHFDRILRPGVATTTNALRLMQMIGLDLGESDRTDA